MKSGLFAFILLSALVHAVVISIKSDWVFSIHDSHEQGRSSLNIELFAKTQPIENTHSENPVVTSNSIKTAELNSPANITPVIISPVKIDLVSEKLIKIKPAQKSVTPTQQVALLNSALNNKDTFSDNTKIDINNEKIKALLNNELSKHFYYPKSAQRKNRQGKVLLAFTITPHGKIININVKLSSGFKVLDEAAIKALKKIDANKDLAKALNGDSLEHTLPIIYKLTRH